MREKAGIPLISANYTKFHEIPGNLVNFTKFSYFWQNGSRISKSGISEQLFKAEIVRFREHFRVFAKFQLFREIAISMKIRFLSGNSSFFGPNRTFPARGLQKNSQKLTFIKVSEPGSQEIDSGPKSHFWAPEMLKIVKFRIFWSNERDTLRMGRIP